MSSRILLPNGAPAPEPQLNMKDLLVKARHGWAVGKKAEAFEAVCTGLELCSAGIARLMTDVDSLNKKSEKQ